MPTIRRPVSAVLPPPVPGPTGIGVIKSAGGRPLVPHDAVVRWDQPYLVRKGDTLFRIAERLGLDPYLLVNVNPGLSHVDRIRAGQNIYVPVLADNAFVVRRGQTLREVAEDVKRLYGLGTPTGSVEEAIRRRNPQLPPRGPSPLYAGEVLMLPTPQAILTRYGD